MSEVKRKVHNKSQKPDNIAEKEAEIFQQSYEIEDSLPSFLRSYFLFLKSNVLPQTRLAYLQDVKFFFWYLQDAGIFRCEPKDVTLDQFNKLTAEDINLFFDYCRHYVINDGKTATVYENSNRTLARKKSSLTVMFKELYREGRLEKNITDGFVPIRVSKASEREIKALHDNEVMVMLDAVSTGVGLTEKEKQYWQKTKKRDKAILMLFLTYGLRVSELEQLNISSINFSRGEFKIYRKRGKEALMPLNQSVTGCLADYIDNERPREDVISEEHKDALFLSLQGKRMTVRQLRELVKKYTSIALNTSRDCGYSPHKLRATAATSLIGRGNSIYDVAALLDHEQVTTTQLYARHREGVKRDLVKAMEWEIERKEE